LPEVRDLSPGNAAPLYQRAQSYEWAGYRQRPELRKVPDWLRMPLKEIPRREAEAALPPAAMLREVELAARREYCDWEVVQRLRQEGYSLTLPDVQGYRTFGQVLALRARFELADERPDKALHTLQTGFALARHVATAPVIVNGLVGSAVTHLMLDRLEEVLQAPGAPNLYWSLTALPAPFIDLRASLQGERLVVDHMLEGFREVLEGGRSARPLSRPEVEELTTKLFATLSAATGEKVDSPVERLNLMTVVAAVHPRAKQFLIERGMKAGDVEALPMIQAVLLLEVHNYDRYFDEQLKWFGVPYWQARAGMAQADQEFREGVVAATERGMTLVKVLMAATYQVYLTGVRIDRRIAALRCVEAIRLHAARQGRLPAALSAIREVPIPADPVTGKDFEYQLEGGKAVLYGPPPGEKQWERHGLRYEITLAR
jgi:hypothetical protein